MRNSHPKDEVKMTNLDDLKGHIIKALDDNLVCILLTGSRVRGEEREDSDYDLAIIVNKIDGKVLTGLRNAFSSITNYSVYLLKKYMVTSTTHYRPSLK